MASHPRTQWQSSIVDFRYMGIRCRETTNLEDNAL